MKKITFLITTLVSVNALIASTGDRSETTLSKNDALTSDPTLTRPAKSQKENELQTIQKDRNLIIKDLISGFTSSNSRRYMEMENMVKNTIREIESNLSATESPADITSFLRYASKLIRKDMSAVERSHILHYLAMYPSHEREIVVNQVLSLTQSEAPRILQLFFNIPSSDERQSLIDLTMEFTNNNVVPIFAVLSKLPANERKTIVQLTLDFIPFDEEGYSRLTTLKALSKAEANQREQLIEDAKEFITKDMHQHNRSTIIDCISKFSGDGRRKFMDDMKKEISVKSIKDPEDIAQLFYERGNLEEKRLLVEKEKEADRNSQLHDLPDVMPK